MSATPRNNDAYHVERMSELTRSVSTSILELSRNLKTIGKGYMLREFVDNAYNVALTVPSVATGLGAPGPVVDSGPPSVDLDTTVRVSTPRSTPAHVLRACACSGSR